MSSPRSHTAGKWQRWTELGPGRLVGLGGSPDFIPSCCVISGNFLYLSGAFLPPSYAHVTAAS